MSLSIRPVTKDNWETLAYLKVRDDQKHFVASNLYSIAEAQFGEDSVLGHWDAHPFGIYDGDTPVGFLMIEFNFGAAKMQGFVARLMVDENLQGRGYGRFGMQKMLEIFQAEPRVKVVGISYEPENEIARRLYASFGFEETGEMWQGETLALLRLRLDDFA
jgi:diamine N-acetyltransferase